MTAAKTATVGAVMFLLGLAGGQSNAHAATTPNTLTVTWSTTADPTKPLPTDSSNVPWPQHLLAPVPSCLPTATVVQVDVYQYDKAHKAAVDALIAHGVLDAPGSGSKWTDSDFVTSWTFRVIPACAKTSPSPSPTASTDSPTPSPTVSTSTPAPSPTTDSPSPTASSPEPTATTSLVEIPPKADTYTPPAPKPSASTSTEAPLANTGAPTGQLAGIGAALLAAGIGLVAFVHRKGKRA